MSILTHRGPMELAVVQEYLRYIRHHQLGSETVPCTGQYCGTALRYGITCMHLDRTNSAEAPS